MVVRWIAAGLAAVAVLAACTEAPRASVAPGAGAQPRAVLVSNGSVKVGTPAVPTVQRSLEGPTRSATAGGGASTSDALAARALSQAAPPARAKAPTATPKPSQAKAAANPEPKAAAAGNDDAKAEPSPTPKPTMRPAHIPRREARPVFAPGRTSFVKDSGRDGIGFFRPGELTPAPPAYAQPRPPPELDLGDEELFDEELEEGTP
jgi:hypothetical protein